MYNLLKGKKGIIFGAPASIRMGELDILAKNTNSQIIPADATSIEDLENLIDKSMEILGGKIDFVLHSIGMSVNVRKKKAYTDPNYDFTHKGWDVSAVSFHKVLNVLYHKKAMNEWGSIVALTYMAAQRVFPDYNDMADNKAYLESIARSFGYYFGRFINFSEKMSPLGNASAADCADYTISLFSDLTKKVTLQNLFHDGGFSNMGVSDAVMDKFE